jgi:hypothetical protein
MIKPKAVVLTFILVVCSSAAHDKQEVVGASQKVEKREEPGKYYLKQVAIKNQGSGKFRISSESTRCSVIGLHEVSLQDNGKFDIEGKLEIPLVNTDNTGYTLVTADGDLDKKDIAIYENKGGIHHYQPIKNNVFQHYLTYNCYNSEKHKALLTKLMQDPVLKDKNFTFRVVYIRNNTRSLLGAVKTEETNVAMSNDWWNTELRFNGDITEDQTIAALKHITDCLEKNPYDPLKPYNDAHEEIRNDANKCIKEFYSIVPKYVDK